MVSPHGCVQLHPPDDLDCKSEKRIPREQAMTNTNFIEWRKDSNQLRPLYSCRGAAQESWILKRFIDISTEALSAWPGRAIDRLFLS